MSGFVTRHCRSILRWRKTVYTDSPYHSTVTRPGEGGVESRIRVKLKVALFFLKKKKKETDTHNDKIVPSEFELTQENEGCPESNGQNIKSNTRIIVQPK